MAMGNRPEVKTAPAPVVALDVGLLAQQLATAMARVPFRHPFAGNSSPASNLLISMTREVIRAFMGYSSALRIQEFRSLELVLDDICKVIMPPVVRSLDVESHAVEYGGVPGVLYRPRHAAPVGLILYLHGGGYIGTSPNMYAFFTARVCRDTGSAVFVADYRLAPEFPYPAGAEDASAAYTDLVAHGVPAERIFLAGDSGGGGLSTTLLLEPLAHVLPVRPAGLVLFSPEVDLRLDETVHHGERRSGHPAVEHPDRRVPARIRRDEQGGVAAHRRPVGVPADLCDLGRRRDVPGPDPPLRRPSPPGRGIDDSPGVSRDVPRLPDPGAVGRGQPRGVRAGEELHPQDRGGHAADHENHFAYPRSRGLAGLGVAGSRTGRDHG